jgi:hypothetical protein
MVSLWVVFAAVGGVVFVTSVAVLAATVYRLTNGRAPWVERELTREKIRAYREIMTAVVALNRQSIDLGSMQFGEEADLMAYGDESRLSDAYGDVAEAYESNYHVIAPGVKEAASDYLDYLATFHDEGAHAGALLSRSGAIVEAMRRDLDLESLFGERESDSPVDVTSFAEE